MLGASKAASADDVCVRCRVRRSETASKPEFGATVEMVVTLRHWSETPLKRQNSTSSWANPLGKATDESLMEPELILKAVTTISNESLDKSQRYRSPSPYRREMLAALNQSRDSEDMTSQQKININVRRDMRSLSPTTNMRERCDSDLNSISRSRSRPKSRPKSRPGSRRRGMLPPVGTAAAAAAFQVDNAQQKILDSESDLSHSNHISYTIPVSDVVRASLETTPKDKNENIKGYLLYLISKSHGILEFCFNNINSRDIVYAFLSANICQDKLSSRNQNDFPKLESQTSIDMEVFQANKVKDRLKNETVGDRFSRKMSLLMCRVSEVAFAVSDCCLCGSDTAQVGPDTIRTTPGVGVLELYDAKKNDALSFDNGSKSTPTNRTNHSRFKTPEKVALRELPESKILKQSIAANRTPKRNSSSYSSLPDVVKVDTSKSSLDFEIATTSSLGSTLKNERTDQQTPNDKQVETNNFETPSDKQVTKNDFETPQLQTVDI